MAAAAESVYRADDRSARACPPSADGQARVVVRSRSSAIHRMHLLSFSPGSHVSREGASPILGGSARRPERRPRAAEGCLHHHHRVRSRGARMLALPTPGRCGPRILADPETGPKRPEAQSRAALRRPPRWSAPTAQGPPRFGRARAWPRARSFAEAAQRARPADRHLGARARGSRGRLAPGGPGSAALAASARGGGGILLGNASRATPSRSTLGVRAARAVRVGCALLLRPCQRDPPPLGDSGGALVTGDAIRNKSNKSHGEAGDEVVNSALIRARCAPNPASPRAQRRESTAT